MSWPPRNQGAAGDKREVEEMPLQVAESQAWPEDLEGGLQTVLSSSAPWPWFFPGGQPPTRPTLCSQLAPQRCWLGPCKQILLWASGTPGASSGTQDTRRSARHPPGPGVWPYSADRRPGSVLPPPQEGAGTAALASVCSFWDSQGFCPGFHSLFPSAGFLIWTT